MKTLFQVTADSAVILSNVSGDFSDKKALN
jgi:hypothetical protein